VPEIAQPQSAIEHLLKPGLYPRSDGGASGLVIQERPNAVQIQVIARKDQGASLAGRVSTFLGTAKTLAPLAGGSADGIHIYATGPLDYWVFSETHDARTLERRLADELGDTASLFDQSHARLVLRISGNNATGLLAKGTPLDLDVGAFPSPGASHTTIDHIPALVARHAVPVCYDLSVPRSYAGSFWAWLAEAALEFGCTVETPEL
jgi:sarcosine oxidase subunit gamma